VVAAPRLRPDEAEAIAARCYGITGTAQRLAAEHDDAFRLTAADGRSWLLKAGALPPNEAGLPPGEPSFQAAVLLHLAATAPGLPVQHIVPALDGRPETDVGGGRRARLTTWLDGTLLGTTAADAALRRDIGGTLARLNRALRGFRHPGADRTHHWDLRSLPALRPLLDELPPSGLLPSMSQALADGAVPAAWPDGRDGWLHAALAGVLDHFAANVAPRLARRPAQVIHADFHGENLLTAGGRVTGILDFGDALTVPVAMDVGIAACYQLGPGPGRLGAAAEVAAGYHAADPLTAADLALAADFLVARLAARIVISQWNALRSPDNAPYLLRRTPQAIAHLATLWPLPAADVACWFYDECGVWPRPAREDNAGAGSATGHPGDDNVDNA
jgi:hydroxylysine kinase